MASRANKEAREYGAPMGPPPTPDPQREQKRKERLATKPSAEERARRIAEHEKAAREESEKLAQEQRDRKTAAPKGSAYTRVGETTGKPPTQIIAERPGDVSQAIDVAEGVEPLATDEPVTSVEAEPRIPIRDRNPPKRK